MVDLVWTTANAHPNPPLRVADIQSGALVITRPRRRAGRLAAVDPAGGGNYPLVLSWPPNVAGDLFERGAVTSENPVHDL